MADTVQNAIYKRYNGSGWDTFYLKTTAAQVLPTNLKHFVTANTKVNGVPFVLSTDTVDGVANTPVENLTLTLDNIGDGSTRSLTNYLPYTGATANVNLGHHSLSANSIGIYNYGGAGGTAVTCGGFASNGSGTLTIESPNSIELDANSGAYVGSSLSSDNLIATRGWVGTLTGADITVGVGSSNFNYGTSLQSAIDTTFNLANGKNTSYAISSGEGEISITWPSNIVNAEFGSTHATDDSFAITQTYNPATGSVTKAIRLLGGNAISGTDVLLTDLKIGDSVFVSQLDVPDRWVSAISNIEVSGTSNRTFSITFSKLETVRVPIENLVPYTGATGDVNLGRYHLKASTVGVYYVDTSTSTSTFIGGFAQSSSGMLYVETNPELNGHGICLEDTNSYIGSVASANLIATQGWASGAFVALTGDQSIAGDKTFSGDIKLNGGPKR